MTNIQKVNKSIQLLVTIENTTLPKLPRRLYLCLAQEYLAVTVRLGEGGEKSIKNKGDKKRESVSIFLKNKNKFPQNNLFQENKLYKIQLYIFFPMLVEIIKF